MENTPEYLPPVADSEEVPEWKRLLPPGFMFDPEDIELFKDYLLPRVKGEYLKPGVIQEADVYQCQPSQLPGLDLKQVFSYFFTKTDKRYKNGKRLNRCTKDQKGHWRITSKINEIEDKDGKTIIGRKNVLVYIYENKVKTNWIMHEYILDHNYVNKDEGDKFDTASVVLCRIYERKAENYCENSDRSPVRYIQQNHKRESSSQSESQSDDHEETSYCQAKRSKPPMNQTSFNSPLDVQPISQQPATSTMMQTYLEEVSQSLDRVASDYINACGLMDYQAQLYHPFDVQLISQQPAAMMMQTFGEEALPLPSSDQMASNDFDSGFSAGGFNAKEGISLNELVFSEETNPSAMKVNLKGKIEGINNDHDNDFDTDSFFI